MVCVTVVSRLDGGDEAVIPMKNPVLSLPLASVMRMEIALPLQHMHNIYTVGCFLRAWRNPRNHKGIEQIFDTPEQARHAAATCAAWLGFQTPPTHDPQRGGWWQPDRSMAADQPQN